MTGRERRIITEARQLSAAKSSDALRDLLHLTPATPDDMVYPIAFGTARFLLAELADLADLRPEGGGGSTGAAAEDTRRLGAIREVLSHFDWEYHDRQLALEAIERIADGGQA